MTIKRHLVQLAVNDELPSDMNELDLIDVLTDVDLTEQEGFIVLQLLHGGADQPTFRSDGEIDFYDTKKEARKAIVEHVSDSLEAFERGHITSKDSVDDFMIVRAKKIHEWLFFVNAGNGPAYMHVCDDDYDFDKLYISIN